MGKLATSAAYRIAFTYSLALALAIIALGMAVYFAADADFRSQQDAAIAEESAALVRDFREEGVEELVREMAAREAVSSTNAFGYALFDRSGKRVAGALDTPQPPPGWHDISFLDPQEGPDPARAFARDLPNGLRLVVAVDTEALERIDGTILGLFSGAFLFVILVGIVGALILGSYLRRRLDRISGTARAIMSGDLERRMPVGARGDEFDDLALTLNAMLDRIEQLMDNLRQVSSDVAHDLRTPLARLRNQLAGTLDGGGDAATTRAALERAIDQSDDLLSLFAAILRISEVEAGALARTFAPIDLSDLLTDLCDSYAPAISDGGRSLGCEIDPGIGVHGDRELIAQAVINLLDNAQRHTPPGTHIVLAVDANEDTVRLSVADDGPGVARADWPRIVRRFTRLDSSRTTPGHGLGLSLVAAIAAAHGGDVVIGDNAPGLRVTMTLPRAPR
ncbi:MAG: sensor histidine kinase [Sphingomonas bacterium]|uniref:sensor histidine kinase n=1 Tax=Sphingomonas bacterium TaxID=1895847 RepID=UPI00262D7DCC|nr:HAMP domain-containing sensor histidine kinase [Sphingomonas bacterium]MDB5706690.1 sensor histidine kinase [Sphingomonas bacterium]